MIVNMLELQLLASIFIIYRGMLEAHSWLKQIGFKIRTEMETNLLRKTFSIL